MAPFKMKGFSPFHQDKAKQKVDPDAPGTPGKPGYEPPVTDEDKSMPTYKEAWKNMSKEKKDKYGSYSVFVEAAKKYHEKAKPTPIKQDKKGKVTPGEKVKPKFRLAVGTKPDGTKDYFKIDEKGKQIKISKVEHNSLKGN